MEPLEMALDEAQRRVERAERRRADLRSATGRIYGFLGGVMAVAIATLVALGPGFEPWAWGALAVGAAVLLCIAMARSDGTRTAGPDLATHAGHGFGSRLLRARVVAARNARGDFEWSLWWMLRAEVLAGVAAGIVVVGALVVGLQEDSRRTLVPLGAPVAREGGAAAYLLTPGAADGERLERIANPRDGVPLVVSPAGAGSTGCLGTRAGAELAPGQALDGDALDAAVGADPEAPLQVAVCVPGAAAARGRRALELTWVSRALD